MSPAPDSGITLERLPQGKSTYTVEVAALEHKTAERLALLKLAQNIKIEGFRPGKAPEEMLRQKIAPDVLLDQTIRELMPALMKRILDTHEVKPILPPSVEVMKVDPLSVAITFVEKPEVKLKRIDTIKIPAEDHKVEDKDVSRVIDQFLKEDVTETPVDRAAQMDDVVMTDFNGKDSEGKDIPGTNATDYRIGIGSKTLIPGFEEGMIGMKKGETREVKVTFPENYHAEHLKGKPATFTVTAKEVRETKRPELTEELLLKKMGMQKKPDEFRSDIRNSLIEQERQMIKNRREGKLFDEIRSRTTVDLAPELIEHELRSMIEALEHNLESRGLTLEQWLSTTGKKGEDVRKEMEEDAKKRLTLRFGLEKLIEEKEITANDEEVQKAVDEELIGLTDAERKNAQPQFQKGSDGWRSAEWKVKVEKIVEMYLTDKR